MHHRQPEKTVPVNLFDPNAICVLRGSERVQNEHLFELTSPP